MYKRARTVIVASSVSSHVQCHDIITTNTLVSTIIHSIVVFWFSCFCEWYSTCGNFFFKMVFALLWIVQSTCMTDFGNGRHLWLWIESTATFWSTKCKLKFWSILDNYPSWIITFWTLNFPYNSVNIK